jgi:uncharacterized RDD family membrane protein YckC
MEYEEEKPKRGTVDYELADLGTRLVALIIDSVILGVITGVLYLGARGPGGVGGFLVGVIYNWYFLTQQNGQTPGKRWMGVRVVRKDGEPLDAATVIIRYVGYFINSVAFMIGWIWAAFDADKQGWHDKLAGTIVVRA